ncbi:transcription factor bHLH162 [Cocos nucifera]|nr:transcription factor bHLH162 [Cocos nucifera]
MKTCGTATKLERKTIEKNRRLYMKSLCFKLASLIPKDQYTIAKDTFTQEDQLDQAASYIKKLKERVERLKQKKEMALSSRGLDNITGRVLSSFSLPVIDDTFTQEDQLDQAASYIKKLKERVERLKQKKEMALSSRGLDNITGRVLSSFSLPVIDVRHLDSTLEVFIIGGLSKGFIFRDVLSVLEEEGAEAVNASFSIVGDKIFCTIHSQVITNSLSGGIMHPWIK